MKIDYAVVASDDNSTYLDFWPIVAKLWVRLGIKPVLLYFGETAYIDGFGGTVIKMPKHENMPLATCWARYWWAAQQKDKTVIISDIDMLPFSDWYFNRQIEDLDDNLYIHINPCIDTYSRLPSCYHIAKGDTFKQFLNIHQPFIQSLNHLLSLHYDNSTCYIKGQGNDKWCYDEYYATDRLLNHLTLEQKDRLKLIPRMGGESGYRIDRTKWKYEPMLMKNGYYFDSHSIRPYSNHKKEIDNLIRLVK